MPSDEHIHEPSPCWPTLVDMFRARVGERGERVAYTFLGDREDAEAHLTYSELDRRAGAIAAHLRERGVLGSPVLLLYPPGLDYIAGLFGCLYAGVLAVPAYPPLNERQAVRLQRIANDAGASHLLSTGPVITMAKAFSERAKSGRAKRAGAVDQPSGDISSFGAELHWIATDDPQVATGGSWINPGIRSGDLAFLQYTSGSTAAPKGVMLTHANLLHNLRSIAHLFGFGVEGTTVSWLPPYHDMGLIGQILEPIYARLHAHLMSPATFLQSPMRWLKTISRTRSGVSGGPNFAYDLVARKAQPADLENLDLSCWKVAYNGAEPVRGETLERFVETFGRCGFDSKAFYPCYGMAEGTLILSGGEHDARPVEGRFDSEMLRKRRAVVADDRARRLVSSGRPPPDHRIAIVDPENLSRCPDAMIGEIWVSGPSIAAGYWGKAELSRRTFLAATSDGDPGPFLRTGDLGFFLDGELFVVGRLKDLIIVRGRNLHPEDIEQSVSHCHPDVRPGGGAAFAIEHEGEERLVIVQEVARHPRGSHDAIIAAIRRAVAADHGVEVHSIALLQSSSVPKTSSGKIQRYLCREGFLAGELREVSRWTQAERARQPEDEVVAIGEAAQVVPVAAGSPNATSPDRERIEQWLVARVAGIAGAAAASISVDEPLAHAGLGSRDVVGLTGDLEQWLGRRLSPVLAYQYPTIKALAVHLAAGSVGGGGVHRVGAAASETEPIAIVGLSCRFPGAEDPEAFWSLLANAVDAVSERPERWSSNGAVAPDLTRMTTMAGGFLDEVDAFDADFFGISPREVVHMDPQQRLLLEVAWEALERAGALGPTASNGRTGVFVGVSSNDYAQLMVRGGATMDAYVGTGTALSIAANRLSYQLDLRGPSLAVDTACSSSLVAVHLAVRSLRRGECDAALAGGVNLLLSPDPSLAFSRARMMAQRGRCRTFDADADGYVRGEGCGVLVLKRLSDALQNQDHVVALIRGSATNQDGRSNGLTAPNGLAQQAVIREALSDAGLLAGDIDYVEAHGTGTPLGDPIEVEAIKAVLLPDRPADRRCALGSVKTNIGHLEAAAGIAGLIKTALAIEHGQIPAHLHLERLNPAISLEGTPLFVTKDSVPWPSTTAPRRAGVSSFGFGGTNCHIILEQAPASEPRPELPERPLHLLSLSAKSPEALAALAGKFAGALRRDERASLADACFTANVGRAHHEVRLASSASSLEEMAGALSAFAAGESPSGLEAGRIDGRDRTRVAFLFTGQGSQYPGMGRELYETEPRFRRELVRCEAILRDHLQEPLLSVMYGDRSELLNETEYTQAAIFSLAWSLVELWRSWGIEPRGVIGHSVGEYVAACVAGVFGPEDALTLVAARGRLMQALPRDGAMAALRCREDVTREALERFAKQASIAAVNGLEDIVVSGRRQAVERICAELEARGVSTQLLNVSHAFHSPLMEPMLDDFEAVAQRVMYRSPRLDLISNVTGKRAGDDVCSASYWRRHARQGVMFWEGLQTLRSEGYSRFLELGPAPALTALGRRQALDGETWAWSLRRNRSDWSQMLESLGRLHVKGAAVSWTGFDAGRNRRRVALPTYAFERRRFWFKAGAVKRVAGHPLLGQRMPPDHLPDVRFLVTIRRELTPFLADHRVSGTVIYPTTGYIEMALAGAAEILGPGRYVLEDLLILRPLVVGETAGQQTRLTFSKASASGWSDFTIGSASAPQTASAELYAVGRIAAVPGVNAVQAELPDQVRARMKHSMSREEFYRALTANGLEYGEAFRGVQAIWLGDGEALGRIALPEILDGDSESYHLHPVLLDSCFQLLGAAALDRATSGTYVPVGLQRLTVVRRPESSLWGKAQLRTRNGASSEPDEALEGDLQLFDEAGTVVASIAGLSLRRASAAQLQRMREQPAQRGATPSDHPLLGTPMRAIADHRDTHHWETELDPGHLHFAGVYRENGAIVLPLAAIAEMALAATAQVHPEIGWGFSSVELHQPLMFGNVERRLLQVSLASAAAAATVRVYTRPVEAGELGADWALHATAIMRPEKPSPARGASAGMVGGPQ